MDGAKPIAGPAAICYHGATRIAAPALLMKNAVTVTTLLRDWRSGDRDALERLTPLVYDDLRRIAGHHLGGERRDHTLQATALVNEAFVRLSDAPMSFEDRSHFLAVCARVMRRILIDYGRARRSRKRGGSQVAVTLHEDRIAGGNGIDFTDLDDALTRLEAIDVRKSEILVLHYFGGLTYDETGEVLDISAATVDRELRFAKAWLANELRDD